MGQARFHQDKWRAHVMLSQYLALIIQRARICTIQRSQARSICVAGVNVVSQKVGEKQSSKSAIQHGAGILMNHRRLT